MFDLVFDNEGPGDRLILPKLGLGFGEKLTLFGGGLGVVGMLILTKSSPETSTLLEGISKNKFCLLLSELEGLSSLISAKSSTYYRRGPKKKKPIIS